MIKNTLTTLLLFASAYLMQVQAVSKDTIHVVSHNKTLMITDPKRGVNEVVNWATFPSKEVPYRKITAHLTMQCPDGKKCGAWDYLDYVIIRRLGGTHAESKNIEIIRNLTPYGAWFDDQWRFTWEQDVTDWGYLLRDSVEIEYQHTGYEGSEVGWLVTVDFEIVTGRPVMEAVGYDSLWNKSYAYGDTLRPFETLVTPKTLNTPKDAAFVNYRIVQTGHGMDRPDNCSEFCTKWRDLYFDGKLINHRDMTIVCGDNPLYPQAGTWVYSRSNWCPGSLAIPDIFTLPVSQPQHTFDLKMEPYVSNKPSGGWSITAHAFYYKNPTAKNDVALEQIMAPSTKDAYGRMNPVCASPRILIKNNGSDNLKNLLVEYGLKGQKKQEYLWTGDMPFLQTQDITLPGTVEIVTDSTLFEVKLSKPNGKKDEYLSDNSGHSMVRKVPVYGTSVIVSFRTNKEKGDTSWQLKDANGHVVYQRGMTDSLRAETLYNDTLRLPEGCYEWTATDLSNDGLSFWANPRAGYGYIRLLNDSGQVIQGFGSDFGTSIRHSFRVSSHSPSMDVAPNSFEIVNSRVKDLAALDIILNKKQNIVIRVLDKDNQIIVENTIKNFSSCLLQLDLSFLPLEMYQLQLQTEDGMVLTKRFKKI